MALHIHKSDDLAAAVPAWEGLLRQEANANFFVTPAWLGLWWRHFGPGYRPEVLTVLVDEEPVGIAPLMARDGLMTLMGDKDLCDYRDFLVRRGYEGLFYRVLCDYLAGQPWRTLLLESLPQGSPTLEHLPPLVEAAGYRLDLEREDVTPALELPATWDEYLASLSRKDRHELRRKLRRLEREGTYRQYECDLSANLPRCMEQFFALLRASRPDKDQFLTPERERFFLDMAQTLAPLGLLRLFFLELEGRPVAACICFDYGDTFLLYNSGYDPAYARLSVGLLNKALCIQQAIQEGKRAFNFLRGDERYKYDLGGRDRAIYTLTVRQ